VYRQENAPIGIASSRYFAFEIDEGGRGIFTSDSQTFRDVSGEFVNIKRGKHFNALPLKTVLVTCDDDRQAGRQTERKSGKGCEDDACSSWLLPVDRRLSWTIY
jgi:hypothetical protein